MEISIGLILHLAGDYIFQNDWMANQKTQRFLPAFLHASIYALPFLFLCDFYPWLFLYLSHFLIDRYRLAVYWIKLVNWKWESKNFGYNEGKPLWMSIWLMIIIDNTFHVIINTICILISK